MAKSLHDELRDFFECLAVEHKDILHNAESAKRFHLYGPHSFEWIAKQDTDCWNLFFHHSESRLKVQRDCFYTDRATVTLDVMRKLGAKQQYRDRECIYNDSRRILDDILERLIHPLDRDKCSRKIDKSSVNWSRNKIAHGCELWGYTMQFVMECDHKLRCDNVWIPKKEF